MKTRTRLIAVATAAVALILAGAAPAFADHTAGSETGEGCEYGAMLAGGPPTTLGTGNITVAHVRGTLTLVCSFTVPLFVPACSPTSCVDYKDDWTAPNRPKAYRVTECYAPGTDLAGATQPNGTSARAAERAVIVFYRTRAVMTCFWKDDPTNDPGYWDQPAT